MFLKAGDTVAKRTGFYKCEGTVKRVTKTRWGRYIVVKPEKWLGKNIPAEYSWRFNHNMTEEQASYTLIKARPLPKPTRTKAKNGKWVKCLVTKIL